MARADWRSASAYEELRTLDAPAFAYEFLCRNPEFLADRARLTRAGRKRSLQAAETEEFSRRWGVRFRKRRRHRQPGVGAMGRPRPAKRDCTDRASG